MEELEFENIEVRTLRVLEWERLKSYLASECTSEPGMEACRSLALHTKAEEVKRALDETSEAQALVETRNALIAQGLTFMEPVVQRLNVRGALSCHELLQIQTTLTISKLMRASLSLLSPDAFPQLQSFVEKLPGAEKLLRAISDCIDETGIVKDEASHLLRDLRREVLRLEASIKDTLQRLIHSSTVSKALSEPLYTQRNGRYVLPVNASMRSSLNGIVHDSSASGLTVYVEPLAVVEIANKIRIKSAEIEREVARILDELSNLAASFAHEVSTNYETIICLDVIMAKAKLSLRYKGTKPEISEEHFFDFKKCRHPLLVLQSSISEVVPNDIALGQTESRTLIITGPNTGGKTVLLKTVGIFALMVRAGLMLPVEGGSVASIFKRVCADIGDEQSLEQSLSTFSSHMKNIVAIVGGAAPGVLLLLDEIGAGTDPKEGAALAQSILEFLNHSGAVTISTTHYSELKTMAYTAQGFINGSLDFDDVTLSPTYRLRLGVPGSSKAITIARRLGLNTEVVDAASVLVEQADIDIQRTIAKLEERLLAASKAEDDARQRLLEAERLKAQTAEALEYIERESSAARKKNAAEFESEMKLGVDYVKHLIADLQRQPTMQKAQQAQQDLEKLRKELKWEDKKREPEEEPAVPSIGQLVRVRSLNQRGSIIAVPQESDKSADAAFTIQVGTLKIKTPLKDLEVIKQQQQQPKQQQLQKQKQQTGSGKHRAQSGGTYSQGGGDGINRSLNEFIRTQGNTLDLRGQRVEAGLDALERFLDESLVTGTSPLMIIHGHGTGAMKSAVRDYLKSRGNAVTEFRSGESHEGGDGVTIAFF